MPAAYGDSARRVAQTEIASFDAWNFPFWTPAGRMIEDGAHEVDPIPTFTAPAIADSCLVTSEFVPQAACIPLSTDRVGGTSPRTHGGLPFTASDAPASGGGRVLGLVAPDGAGASVGISESVTLAGFARSAGRLDGQATGAFSFAGGSSLGTVRLSRSRALNGEGRWRFDGEVTVAFDSPRGIGQSEGSMFEAGPALLTSWTLALTSTGGSSRTRISLSQPPRAESGTGHLSYPAGRRLDGTHIHETRKFSLRPSRRTLTAGLAHRRPFAGGEAIVSVHRTENPGHAPGRARHGGGIALRWSF